MMGGKVEIVTLTPYGLTLREKMDRDFSSELQAKNWKEVYNLINKNYILERKCLIHLEWAKI